MSVMCSRERSHALRFSEAFSNLLGLGRFPFAMWPAAAIVRLNSAAVNDNVLRVDFFLGKLSGARPLCGLTQFLCRCLSGVVSRHSVPRQGPATTAASSITMSGTSHRF
jgi:hypothetical protein